VGKLESLPKYGCNNIMFEQVLFGKTIFKIDVYLFGAVTFQPGNYIQPTQNSTHTKFNPHKIQPTQNSTHTKFNPHKIQPTQNSTHTKFNPHKIQPTQKSEELIILSKEWQKNKLEYYSYLYMILVRIYFFAIPKSNITIPLYIKKVVL
jgi:hypothetical protein